MAPDFAFSSTAPASGGLAAVEFSDVAIFLDFAAVFVGLGLNAVRFESFGVMAAVLEKQPCDVHLCTISRGGMGELQPIKIAQSALMRSVLINTLPVCPPRSVPSHPIRGYHAEKVENDLRYRFVGTCCFQVTVHM